MREVRVLASPHPEDPFWHLKAGSAISIDYAMQRVTLQDTRVWTMDRLEELALADLSKFGHVCPLNGGPPMIPKSWRRKRGAGRPRQASAGRDLPPQPPPMADTSAAQKHVAGREVAVTFTSPPIPGKLRAGGPVDRCIAAQAGEPAVGAPEGSGLAPLAGATDPPGGRKADEAREEEEAPIQSPPRLAFCRLASQPIGTNLARLACPRGGQRRGPDPHDRRAPWTTHLWTKQLQRPAP